MMVLFQSFLSALLFSLPFPGLIFKEGLRLPWFDFTLSLLGLMLFFKNVLTLPKKKNLLFFLSFLVFVYFGVFYWVTKPIHEFKGIPEYPSHLFGLLFFIVNFGHYLLVWLFAIGLDRKRWITDPVSKCLALALSVAILDHFYPQILPPTVGHIFNFLPSPLWASVGGAPLLSFVLIFVICLFWISQKKEKILIGSSFIILIIAVEFSTPLLYQAFLHGKPKTLPVSLIQPNIPNSMKLKSEVGDYGALRIIMTAFVRQTKKAKGLVIWPETAVPVPVFENEMLPGEKQAFLFKNIFQIRHFIFGAFIKQNDKTYTNSLVLWHEGKIQRYDKAYLKPFAEEMPLGPFKDSVASFLKLDYPLIEGQQQGAFNFNGVRIIGNICYEALKPNYIRDVLNEQSQKPHMILNAANDAWFGSTSQPYLHFFMNQWISKVFNLPILRASNTGITGIIYPNRPAETIPWNKEDILNSRVVFHETSPTLFQKFSILPTFFLATLFWVLAKILKRKNEQ